MSGFFAVKRSTYEGAAGRLNPIDYKIGLELIVKCGGRGSEKSLSILLTGNSAKANSPLLSRPAILSTSGAFSFTSMGLVQSGAVPGRRRARNHCQSCRAHLLIAVGAGVNVSIGAAIAISMVFNFFLNRRFTFSYARNGPILRHFFEFVAACSLGALLNYFVASAIISSFPALFPQVAAFFGIVAGTGVNFTVNRFAVFKTTHYRPI